MNEWPAREIRERHRPPSAVKSLTRQAVTGTAWTSASTAAKQLLSLASVAILARLLGPETYGLMAMAAVVTAFLVNFRDMGTATAIIQRDKVSDALLSSLFWLNCVIGVTLALIVVAVSVPAARFFHDARVAVVLRVLSISFIVTSAGVVHNAILSRRMSFGQLAIVDIASSVGGYAVAIPLALSGFGVWSLVFATLATPFVATILYWYFSGWRPTWTIDPVEIRSISRFSLNLSAFGVVNYFSRNADNVIVGRTLGQVPLGFYQMAYNLMLYPIQNISSVVSQVLLPAFSKIKDDNERFRSAYVRGCALIALVTFPVIAGLGVVADPFVRAVLGDEWLPSIVIFQILAPVGVMQSVQHTVGHIYVLKGRTDWMFRWGAYGAAVFVSAFLMGVQYGVVGVATAYCAAYFVLILVPGFVIPFRLIDLRLGHFVHYLSMQIVITGAMVGACWLWLQQLNRVGIADSWTRLLTGIVVGVVVYIAGMMLLRPPVITDLEELLHESYPTVARTVVPMLRVFARA